jgi:hypothetical protein
VVERYLDCANPMSGFARMWWPDENHLFYRRN